MLLDSTQSWLLGVPWLLESGVWDESRPWLLLLQAPLLLLPPLLGLLRLVSRVAVAQVLTDRLVKFELLVTALVLKIDTMLDMLPLMSSPARAIPVQLGFRIVRLAFGGSTWYTADGRTDHLAATSGATPGVQTLVTACLRLL